MPKKIEGHIGDKLLAAINAKGVSQADVARQFKVAPATVSSDWIKHGRIAKKHIVGLVNYFELPYEYWLGSESDGATKVSDLTPEQQQILLIMNSISTEAREALLKAVALLSQSNKSAVTDSPKPQSRRGVIGHESPVEFQAPLLNKAPKKRKEQ